MRKTHEGHATPADNASGLLRGSQVQLKEMSAASIDRLLRGLKVKAGKKPRPPKPAVKALVEVRAESWQTHEVGWTEVDTVAHCGRDMGGDFIWTLTSVEISSGW